MNTIEEKPVSVLSRAEVDNIDLTRVGPGTVMGRLMRCYWIPAALSSELQPGGDPMRLLLLGERLVAFRSPSGTVGIMDHRCPHRNASLFFGRNEEGGLRCIYHGWQFDATGACVDMPNVPKQHACPEKVKSQGYATHEEKGLIWVYMGDPAKKPPLPRMEIGDANPEDMEIEFLLRECNYMQALEGDIDTSHLGFLHVGHVEPEQLDESDLMRYVVGNRAPELEVSDAPWGTTYCAAKDAGDGKSYLRFANFLFPFWTQAPQGEFETNIFSRAWVPLDDTHTMSVTIRWRKRPPVFKKMKDGNDLPGIAPIQYAPRTTDWFGRWVPAQNMGNDYFIDREAQREGRIYSGILCVPMQDQAVTESMGEISDRSREHLVPSDVMIVRTRRRLLQAARAHAATGELPPGVLDPTIYRDARGGETLVENGKSWAEHYEAQLREATRIRG